MKEDFVDFNLAKKLKEKGFKEKCVAHYFNGSFDYNLCQYRGVNIEDLLMSFANLSEIENLYDNYKKYIDAPTIFQVLKWLREEKKIHILIPASFDKGYWWEAVDFNRGISEYSEAEYQSYEEAALAGIEYVLDNLI